MGDFATALMNWMNDTTGLTNNAMTRLLFPANLWHSFDHRRALPAYFDVSHTIPILPKSNCKRPLNKYIFFPLARQYTLLQIANVGLYKQTIRESRTPAHLLLHLRLCR